VLVGTEHDGLVAVGEPGEWEAEPRITVWPGPLGGPGVCGNRDDSPLVELGAMHWQYPEDQMGESEAALVAAPPAVVDDDLFVPLAGKSEERGIACLPVGSATLETPKPRWLYRTDHPVLIPPVVSGATVLAVDGRPGDEGRRLHAVDRATGELRWSAPVSPDATGTLACSEDEVFVQDAGQALSCLHRGGERRWSQPLGRMEHPPSPLGDLLVVTLTEPPSLAVLDRPTGRRLWQRRLDASLTTAPVMAEPAVLVGTVAGLEARSLLDGSAIEGWSGQAEGVSGPLLLWRERIAYVSSSGELSLVSREDGRPLGRSAGAVPGFAPLPCRDRILFLGRESIQAIRVDPGGFQGEPEPWADTSWLGRPTASMVLSGGSVYVGMAGWGIVRWGAP
jgi:outer membrane protein assembly factor BamB